MLHFRFLNTIKIKRMNKIDILHFRFLISIKDKRNEQNGHVTFQIPKYYKKFNERTKWTCFILDD